MSNIKISEMAEASSLGDSDLLTIVQSGVNKKITKTNAIGNIITALNNPTYVSGTGKTVTLNNTRVGPIKQTIKGETTQTTYTGVNKVGPLTDFIANDPSLTVTYNTEANSITVKHTTTAAWKGIYKTITGLTANATMTISAYATTTTSTGWSLSVRNSGGTLINETTNNQTNTETHFSFTIPNDGEITIKMFAGYGDVAINDTATYSKIQLETGSSVTAYEPYVGGIPSPNPNYPQDVITVTGENQETVCGKNLFDNSITNNQWLNASGAITTINGCCIQRSGAIAGQTYTLTEKWAEGHVSANGGIITFYDKDGNMLSKNPASTTGTTLEISKTAPENTAYMYYGHYIRKPTEIQMEKGTATTYQAYEGETYEINLGKNVWNLGQLSGTTAQGVKIMQDADGGFSLYGTSTGTGQYRVTLEKDIKEPVTIFLKTQDTNGNIMVSLRDSNATQIKSTRNLNSSFIIENYTPTAAIHYLEVAQITNGASYNGYKIYAMVVKGTYTAETIGEYAPYFSPIELCKIENFQDNIHYKNGKWWKHEEVLKLTFDGTETWTTRTVSAGTLYETSVNGRGLYSTDNTTLGLSNQYKAYLQLTNNNEFRILSAITLTLHNDNIGSVANLKTFLETNKLVIYYPLAAPKEIPITEPSLVNQLNALKNDGKSYFDITNINVITQNAQPTIEAEAYEKI